MWVAHRGAGKLAPENTLAAFRLGASHGYRMFECDVKLSADDVPFLLHDATLGRTTNGGHWMGHEKHASAIDVSAKHATQSVANVISSAGTSTTNTAGAAAGDHPWRTLSQLDAGSWHSRAYAGEPLPTLANVAAFILRNGYFLNIEIKPVPGTERHTGEVVAREAARLWKGAAVPPLVTSFNPEALHGAVATAPHLPRGLLLDTLWSGWLESALQLGCVAIVCNHALWDKSSVTQAKSAGFRCLSYTVNDEWAAQRLIDLGTDGIITDRVDVFSPAGL
jgi:glycerophosphoryl diester phosphodiesterase